MDVSTFLHQNVWNKPWKKWNTESSESQTFWFFSLHIPASFTKMCDAFPSCVKRNAIIDIFVVWLLHYRTEWILCLHDLWPTLTQLEYHLVKQSVTPSPNPSLTSSALTWCFCCAQCCKTEYWLWAPICFCYIAFRCFFFYSKLAWVLA